jgi:hypothetical protein
MSSVYDNEEFENKLSLVIKKVQEGKTHICITNITNDRSRNIHIVLTMNTIASNEQFFGRMEVEIGSDRIIVFNSKKTTAGECHHAKDVSTIFKLIREKPDIKVIVCCAHITRIRNSIPDLFIQAGEMSSFANRKFIVHIDEAHKYIKENKQNIRDFNSSPIVKSIIGYSGSPNGIWSSNPEDPLFHKILIRDIAEEFNIISSPEYFGVNRGLKHCDHIIVELEPGFDTNKMIEDANIDENISTFAWHYGGMVDKEHARRVWYDNCFPFDLGNEIMFLSYLDYILRRIEIPQDSFSYNFVPAYNRKVTHYQTVEIIHSKFSNANVIVINGNGMQLFRLCSSILNPSVKCSKPIITDKDIVRILTSPDERKRLLEPSYMIQMLIRGFENCPTFITGQTCVSMSVTLINQNIGNFDNVIIAHQHLSDDKSYQLCRFLFNYARWAEENKQNIKTTRLYSLTKSFIDKCIQYEESVEHMGSEFAGRMCSLREIQGFEPEEPSEEEKHKEDLKSIKPNTEMWKKFKVYDGNDEEQWTRVNAFYKDKIGKDIPSRSKPKKYNPNTQEESDFYYSSTTEKLGIQLDSSIKSLSTQSWHSTFQLMPNKLNYARIFVGYDNLDDSTEYTIYVKYAQLIDTPKTREILSYKKKKPTGEGASAAADISEEEE